MSTVLDFAAPPSVEAPSKRSTFVAGPVGQVLALVILLVGGTATGVLMGSDIGSSKGFVVIVGALVGAAMALVAATRFWSIVLVLFTVRSLVDALKVGSFGDTTSTVDPGIIVGLVFLAAGSTWLFAQWRSGLLHPLSTPTKWFFALAAAGTLSSAGSAAPMQSLQVSLKIWAGALMWGVLEQLYRDQPNRAKQILTAGAISLVVPALVAFLQLRSNSGTEAYLSVSRIRGTFVHPNPFATFLVILATIAVAVLPHVHAWARVAAWVVFLVASVLTVFTYARAGWVALVLGLAVIGICQNRRIIAALVVGVLFVLVAVPSVTSRLSDLDNQRVDGRGDPNSLAWRVDYWKRLVPLTKANPVTGIGLEQVLASQPEKLQPHNVFVQTLVETGMLGFISLCGLCISAARALRRATRQMAPGLGRGFAVGGAAAAAGVFFQLGSENLLTQAAIHWYLGAAVAWAVTLGGLAPANATQTP